VVRKVLAAALALLVFRYQRLFNILIETVQVDVRQDG
jgi:hypothetical protein